MILNPPKSEAEANSPEGKQYTALFNAFNKNNWPRNLIVNGRSWVSFKDNDGRSFSGGELDGGFHHYGQLSLNREKSVPVEITEADVTPQFVDTPNIGPDIESDVPSE